MMLAWAGVSKSMLPLPRFHPTASVPPRSTARRGAAGFTLVELMVVVLIITILAVIAVPGISRQLANRRARTSADFIATLYRNARLRAMARGSAVLVRFDAATSRYEVREAIWGVQAT
ncbi:MAG TPA: prepilin-type N-terminal cleavage/methylation domain-containing protein, partial [Polyangiaceae bacterium]|nr:prepilin-type N-terminal cleavage/methylation domain-containing protein [Polyangiaceae bacterium]